MQRHVQNLNNGLDVKKKSEILLTRNQLCIIFLQRKEERNPWDIKNHLNFIYV